MSSTGAGYDYSCVTYSPDGRIYQVEYAQKAVENSGTAIGIKCRDGVLLAVEKPQISKMLVAGSNRRVFGVDAHAGIAITGFAADGRQLVHQAREDAQNYRETYGHKIIPKILASRLGQFVHYYTTSWSLRPFGSSTLLAAYDEDTRQHELYMVEPSGLSFRYFGCAAGKGAQAARTEIEKIFTRVGGWEGLTVREAVKELANIFYTIRDTSKDKPFELEMCWVCEESQWKYSLVPQALLSQCDQMAQMASMGGASEEKMDVDA